MSWFISVCDTFFEIDTKPQANTQLLHLRSYFYILCDTYMFCGKIVLTEMCRTHRRVVPL